MPKGPVGTMDTLGWVTEPTLKADRKIAYWFACRKDQCEHVKDIDSFHFIKETVQGHKGSVSDMTGPIRNSLSNVLMECFEEVTVEVNSKSISAKGYATEIFISATVWEDGKSYDVATSVIINDKTFELVYEGRNARLQR